MLRALGAVKSRDVRLREAAPDDAPAVVALLNAADLPTDLDTGWFPAHMVVAERAGAIVGAAGFEQAGGAGLLRSVVVAPALRGCGLGEQLARDRLAAMARSGCGAAYLLTTSAASYFERLGFVIADRGTAPAALRQLGQFTSICPASAVCMRRPLTL